MPKDFIFPYKLRKKTLDNFIYPKIQLQRDIDFIKSLYRNESNIFILKDDISNTDKNKAGEIFKNIGFTIIPNNSILFRYINPSVLPIDQKEIPPAIFMNGELSCDWEEYCKEPQKSIHISQGKTCILVIEVCEDIRNPAINGQKEQSRHQDIFHNPVKDHPVFTDNIAHSLIAGKKRNPVAQNISESTEFYDNYIQRMQETK